MTLWRVSLTGPARKDFTKILVVTRRDFGDRQQAIYRDLLLDALAMLAKGPDIAGSVSKGSYMAGLRSLHCSRRGRHGSHQILYRCDSTGGIEVLRILHEKMDIGRHLPKNV